MIKKKKTDNFLEQSAVCKCSTFWLLDPHWNQFLLFFSYYVPREHTEKFSINVKCHIFRTEESELWYQTPIIAYQYPNGEAESVLEKHGKLTCIPKKQAQLG